MDATAHRESPTARRERIAALVDLGPAPELECPQAVQEMVTVCGELWLAALRTYFEDATRGYHGTGWKGTRAAYLEALNDLTGNRSMLARLCAPLDVDPQAVGDGMAAMIDEGKRWHSPSFRDVSESVDYGMTALSKAIDRYERKSGALKPGFNNNTRKARA